MGRGRRGGARGKGRGGRGRSGGRGGKGRGTGRIRATHHGDGTPILRVNGYSERWLHQGFPWVYPKELVGDGPRNPGTEVVIVGPSGEALGRGLMDDGWLAARVLRHDDGPLDEAWIEALLDRAETRRRGVLPPETDAWRVLHGENDGLPGVRVDHWAGWLVMVWDTPALAPILPRLQAALVARHQPEGLHLCYRPDPRDTVDLSDPDPAVGWLMGEAPSEDVLIREDGVRLLVRPGEGPDIGAYMDMREVRRWLKPHWAGRRVLNTFAHTGAFSVAAAVHGASKVSSVDLSAPYLDRARANFEANDLDPDAADWHDEDVFKVLDRLRRTGERFDLVLIDPPSFSHDGSGGTWSSKKDMPRLVAAAARVLDPGGWLVVASNQGQLSPKAFRGQVASGLKKADRTAAELAWLGAAPDFPADVSFPEGHYLKVGVWTVD